MDPDEEGVPSMSARVRTAGAAEEPPLPAEKPAPKRFWLGIAVEFDAAVLPTANDVCLPATQSSSGYLCANRDGSGFPTEREASFIQVGQADDSVAGGLMFRDRRLLFSFDYALTKHVMLGGRFGFAWNDYPGSHAQGWLHHVHLEARGTYLFGESGGQSPGLSVYALLALGAAEFDTKVNVTVTMDAGPRAVDAWKVDAPVFTSFGGGVRLGITPTAALMMAPVKIDMVFEKHPAVVWAPEVGVQVGF
jgi:hypothetical protein